MWKKESRNEGEDNIKKGSNTHIFFKRLKNKGTNKRKKKEWERLKERETKKEKDESAIKSWILWKGQIHRITAKVTEWGWETKRRIDEKTLVEASDGRPRNIGVFIFSPGENDETDLQLVWSEQRDGCVFISMLFWDPRVSHHLFSPEAPSLTCTSSKTALPQEQLNTLILQKHARDASARGRWDACYTSAVGFCLGRMHVSNKCHYATAKD